MFNVGAVQGYLKLNTSGWVSSMSTAQLSLQSLSRMFTRTGMVVLGSVALIEREFGKFDKAIRHATSVTLDLTEAQFEEMSEMALDASVKWNKAAKDTAQAFYFLGSAGLTATEQMQTFNDTIMLSRAMGSDLATTVEGMVDIVRAFGLEFANSTEIADQLTKTVVTSNQMFADLDKALSYASSTARLTNNTLAETAAMLGVMANAGIKGSMAGTVLRRAMTNLMSPTAGMNALMYELGLRVYDATGQIKPFINIMGEISDKLESTSDAYKNMVFEVLFGRRAIAGQITLFNYGSVALRKYANEIENSGGTAAQVASKQMLAFTERLGQLWREVQRASITLGEVLAPAITRVADQIRYSMEPFKEYVEANKKAIMHMMKWSVVVSIVAVILPPLLLVVTGLVTQFGLLAVAAAKAGIALATSPYTLLAIALYTLRATLATDFWREAWENKIKPFLAVMGEGFTQTITQIMWQLSLIPEAIEKAFTKPTEFILDWAKQMKLLIEGIFTLDASKIGESIRMGNARLKKLLEPGILGIETTDLFGSEEERNKSYANYMKALTILGNEVTYRGKEIVSDVGSALKEMVKEDLAAVGSLITGIADILPASFKKAIAEIEKAFGELSGLFDIFMIEPALIRGLKVPGVELPQEFVESMENLKRLARETQIIIETSKRDVTWLADQWTIAVAEFFEMYETEVKQWADSFMGAMGDIRSEWGNTMTSFMNDTATMARTIENLLESMFLSILHAFNKMIAEIAANDLLFALFGIGKGGKFPTGMPSLAFGATSLWSQLFGGKGQLAEPMGPPAPEWWMHPFDPGEQSPWNPAQKAATGVEINITNQGNPVDLTVTGRRFDGKRWVIDAVLSEMSTNPAVAKAIRGGG